MNRRSFLGSIAVAAVAGPKAIERLLVEAQIALQMRQQAHVAITSVSSQPMSAAYRKMQQKLLEGFQLEAAEWDEFNTPVGLIDVVTSSSVHPLRTSRMHGWNTSG